METTKVKFKWLSFSVYKFRKRSMSTFLGFMLLLLPNTNSPALENGHFINHVMVSVSEENIRGIDTHFRKYRIGGIYTFGIVSPITNQNFS